MCRKLKIFISLSNIAWSRNWRKNALLATEAVMALDLVKAVEHSLRGYDEGKIKTHADYCKVQELLISDEVKSRQFVGDGGLIISKIIELESKTRIEFKHACAKTKNGDDDAIINKGLKIVLECNQKVKEDRLKGMNENRIDNRLHVGNAVL